MKCINSLYLNNVSNIDSLAFALTEARKQVVKKIDVAYCENAFGSLQALDLCDEDHHYETTYKLERNHYLPSEIVDHSFRYMQLSTEKQECNGEAVNGQTVYNLYDVDNFIITRQSDKGLHLSVTTDFAVEGCSIKAFNLTIQDVQQLNELAVIAVIDTVLFMLDESYVFNGDQCYEFTSHKKTRPTNHEL